jgi:ABC-type glycerol-3-phosphate transport system permease component
VGLSCLSTLYKIVYTVSNPDSISNEKVGLSSNTSDLYLVNALFNLSTSMAVMNEIFHGFPLSLHKDARIVP